MGLSSHRDINLCVAYSMKLHTYTIHEIVARFRKVIP